METPKNYQSPVYSIMRDQGSIIGVSPRMLNLFHLINNVASLPTTILIKGESGTGKELVAKALHYNSHREGNFVPVNCAGIPSELLESILFGHIRGAFTGAYNSSKGLVENAQNGTLFLDEIGDMALPLQAKILRLLQGREITPVGSNNTRTVDVRVVAATNVDLTEAIREKRFRQDLYYRLNVIPVQVPSLKERIEDIPHLVGHFVSLKNSVYNKKIQGIQPSALQKLMERGWEGNIRELENVLERAFVFRKNGMIHSEDIIFDGDEFNFGSLLEPLGNENRDLPIPEHSSLPRIITPENCSIVVSDPIAISSPSEERIILPGGRWYSQGVLITSPMELSKLTGAYSYGYLRNLVRRDEIYHFELGSSKHAISIAFIAPNQLNQFFKKGNESSLPEIIRKAQSQEMLKLLSQPFGIFNRTYCETKGGERLSVFLLDKLLKKRFVLGQAHGPYFYVNSGNLDEIAGCVDPERRESFKRNLETEIDNQYKLFFSSNERVIG
jgi:transcriptional regulator with AAA-type ATPase domain